MKSRPGLTLLELLLSMTIMVTVFLLVTSVLVNTLSLNRIFAAKDSAADAARRTVTFMTRVIRQAQPSPTGAYPILSGAAAPTATSLTIYSVTDAAGQVQQVRFFLSGTDLRMGVINPVGSPAAYPAANEAVTTLVKNVRNGSLAVFEYFGSAFTGTQSPMNPITLSAIRYVRITLVYDEDPSNTPAAQTIQFSTELRNLKDNY